MKNLDLLKQEVCQAEVAVAMGEFRGALLKHFEVVNSNSTRLINSRWGGEKSEDNKAVEEHSERVL